MAVRNFNKIFEYTLIYNFLIQMSSGRYKKFLTNGILYSSYAIFLAFIYYINLHLDFAGENVCVKLII